MTSAASPPSMHATSPGKAGTGGRAVFWTMKNGQQVEIRAICPDDEERMIKFHKGLSERSVYMRYFASLSLAVRTSHARLARICFADAVRETVLVALALDQTSGEQQILAVGRLNKLSDPTKAEVALLVADEFQGSGLGSELLRQLVQAAKDQHITRIEAEMLRDNIAIQRVLKKFGFRLRLIDPRSVRATLKL
jgi:acetyltransferase